MKNHLLTILVFSLFSTFAAAASVLPETIDFTFSAEEKADIATKNFCLVMAGTETYNHIIGQTNSEYLSLTCDGKTLRKGGRVRFGGFQGRTNEILSQAMGQLQTMGFKVVSCSEDPRRYDSSCTVAKQVMPKQ